MGADSHHQAYVTATTPTKKSHQHVQSLDELLTTRHASTLPDSVRLVIDYEKDADAQVLQRLLDVLQTHFAHLNGDAPKVYLLSRILHLWARFKLPTGSLEDRLLSPLTLRILGDALSSVLFSPNSRILHDAATAAGVASSVPRSPSEDFSHASADGAALGASAFLIPRFSAMLFLAVTKQRVLQLQEVGLARHAIWGCA